MRNKKDADYRKKDKDEEYNEEEELEEEMEDDDDPVMELLAASMPWVISLLFHLGLFLILIFLVWSIMPEEEEKIIFVGPEHSPDPGAKVSPIKRQTKSTTSSAKKSVVPKKSAVNVSGKTENTLDIAGIAGGRSKPGGLGKGTKNGPGLFGTGPEGGGGRAYNVLYVIDRSGSMMETFDALRLEMSQSIAGLQESQVFQIIFFAGSEPQQFGGPGGTLVEATRLNKKKAIDYLESDIVARGQTNPVPAIQKAFEVLKRDAKKEGSIMFLLTDGRFPDNEAVLNVINSMNSDKKVHIYTYLYGKQPQEAVEAMKKIADDNNGEYTYVETY